MSPLFTVYVLCPLAPAAEFPAGLPADEDLLADDDGSFPMPLQLEKTFRNQEDDVNDDNWKNMIVFGDNLQFLKTVYKNDDPIIKDKVKGKIKLIYILIRLPM